MGKSEENESLEDLGIDGRAKLKWIFKNRIGGRGIDVAKEREK